MDWRSPKWLEMCWSPNHSRSLSSTFMAEALRPLLRWRQWRPLMLTCRNVKITPIRNGVRQLRNDLPCWLIEGKDMNTTVVYVSKVYDDICRVIQGAWKLKNYRPIALIACNNWLFTTNQLRYADWLQISALFILMKTLYYLNVICLRFTCSQRETFFCTK